MSRLGSLGLLGLAAAAIAAGAYQLGAKHTDNAWRAQQLEVERAANATRIKNAELGINAVAQAAADKKDMESRYADLDGRYQELRRQGVPLVVARAKRPPAAGVSPDTATCAAPQEREPGPAVHELSGAAVWMWNSALAGHPDVPPDSCRAAGAGGGTAAACTEGSGLTLDDAWANQAENAKRAARNAARLERLRQYLYQQQQETK